MKVSWRITNWEKRALLSWVVLVFACLSLAAEHKSVFGTLDKKPAVETSVVKKLDF